jgi:broad specificity phosphatase PhoE
MRSLLAREAFGLVLCSPLQRSRETASEEVGAWADRVIARARAAEGEVALFAHEHVLRVLVKRLNAVEPSKVCQTGS